jgi:hypothetical protein
MAADLPDGWTLERVRELSGDSEATLISTDRLVVVEHPVRHDRERLVAETVISFHGLCLVRAEDDDDWYMGQLEPDGSLTCWASYGADLAEAIGAL